LTTTTLLSNTLVVVQQTLEVSCGADEPLVFCIDCFLCGCTLLWLCGRSWLWLKQEMLWPSRSAPPRSASTRRMRTYAYAHTQSPEVGGGCWVRRGAALPVSPLHRSASQVGARRAVPHRVGWPTVAPPPWQRRRAALAHRGRAPPFLGAPRAVRVGRVGVSSHTQLYACGDAFAPAKLYARGLPRAYGPPTVNGSVPGSSCALHSGVASAQRRSWAAPTVCAAPMKTAMSCSHLCNRFKRVTLSPRSMSLVRAVDTARRRGGPPRTPRARHRLLYSTVGWWRTRRPPRALGGRFALHGACATAASRLGTTPEDSGAGPATFRCTV